MGKGNNGVCTVYLKCCFPFSFSRHIIWLEVGTSNNDPGVIAHYYLCSIQQLQGIVCCIHPKPCHHKSGGIGLPSIIRCDLETENSTIAYLQPYLRRNCSDSAREMSFRYGRSVSNQVCY